MNRTDLPAAIVAPVDALVRDLLEWARTHGDSDLTGLETVVLERLRALAPHLVGGMITLTQRRLDPQMRGDRPRCLACGTLGRLRGWRSRQMKTVCGPVTWERPWAQRPGCGHSWSPTDQTVGVEAQHRMSATLQQWVVELGGDVSFAEAADRLTQLTGLHVGAETIRTVSEAAGTALECAAPAAMARVEQTRAAVGPVDPAPHQLGAETDGVMVHFRDGWHEVKLGVIGGWDRSGAHDDQHLLAPSYVAAREPVRDFAHRWGAEVARRGGLDEVAHDGSVTGPGLTTLRSVVVLGDGAPWIWNAAAEQFGERIEIVDWFHASEHVWAVAQALCGEGTEAAKAWAEARLEVLKTQGADSLLARWRELVPLTEEARRVVATERGYFQRHRERMRYGEYRALGLPIGSGAAESSARHLVQLRMKRSGARWSDAGGQAIVVLRTHLLTQRAKARAA